MIGWVKSAFVIEGVQSTLKAYGEAKKKDAIAIDQGLKRCAEIILRKSQQLVPVDTGRLKESGMVAGNWKKGFAAEWRVIYSAPYAWFVHEDLNANHPVGQAKFLSAAVASVRGTMTALLKRQMTVTTEQR